MKKDKNQKIEEFINNIPWVKNLGIFVEIG